ncbi:MAG TPA: hypothetical protein VFU97_12675 [Xanthobacteraceae bacterium]|nr:hypothetical protein [Xanthobacteraceae bacterium]
MTIETTFERGRGGSVRKAVAALFAPSAPDANVDPNSVGRADSFSGMQIAVLFVALLMLVSIPILTQQLPPIEDYVNHLARMHVMASLDSDPDLARFYEIQWQIVPNLMMDLVVPTLAHIMGIYKAGQVFTVVTFALIMSGTLAVNRALFGRWSMLPLAATPLLYNYVFLTGVMNYVFGIGLALWATAAWIALRERAWPWRFAVSTFFVGALFFCHLFALGVYGVALLAIESGRLWALRAQPLRPRLVDFVATGLPFLPVFWLLLASPTWQLSSQNYWEPLGKIDGLKFVVEVYSDTVAFLLIGAVAVGIVWAMRQRLLRFHSLGFMLLAVGGATYMALPRMMFATYMADQRLPVALAFLLIACFSIDLSHRLVRRGFLALLLMLLVIRVIEVDSSWANLSGANQEFRDSVKRIKRGSTVLVVFADPSAGDDVRDLGLVHAPCLAMIERAALVTTAFTVEGKQVMHVRPAYRNQVDTEDGVAPTLAQIALSAEKHVDDHSVYWHDWENRFDYVYVLFTEDEAANPEPDRLKLVHDGARFQLYKVLKPS